MISNTTTEYERCSAMLGAIQSILGIFASYGKNGVPLDRLLSDGAALASDVAGIDGVGVFHLEEGKTTCFKQMYRWRKDGGETANGEEGLLDVPNNPATEGWFSSLAANECVSLSRSELSADGAAFFGESGFDAGLAVPVFAGDGLWGAVCYGFKEERRVGGDDVAFLRSVGSLCANLVIQDEKLQNANATFVAYKNESETSVATLTAILNSFDGIILATVPETGEILYINDKNKEFFGAEGDGTGRRCYEFLHGRRERCAYCPYYQLEIEPEKVVRWEPTDPHIDTVYRMTALLIDWPGGKKAHLEFGIDITEVRHLHEILINILGSLNALILATVPETGEILFINDKTKEFFGVKGDGIGKICYKFIHGRTERCDYCPCRQIMDDPDKVIQWESFDPDEGYAHNMTSLLIDWPGGKKAQLDFGVDVTESWRAKEALEKRERMLDNMNRAALVLLSKKDETFEEAMAEGASLIANMANVDRMSISRNVPKKDGLYASQIYRWKKEEGSTVDVLAGLQENSYARHIPRWEKVLAAGECINGPTRLMPEADALRQFGCLTALAIPILMESVFWGFVLFEDLTEERTYTEDEVAMLRSASFMLVNVIIRNEEAEIIREADEHAKLILESMPYACVLINHNYEIFDCNDALVKLFHLDGKQPFLDDPFIISPQYQPDGSSSFEGGMEHIRKAFEKGHYSFTWIHMSKDGELIPTESIFVRGDYKGESIVVGYMRDRREYVKMLREIEVQNVLLHAVNRMSTILLQTNADDFEDDLMRSMGIMGGAVEVERVTIWKNHDEDGRLCCTQTYVWWAEHVEELQSEVASLEARYADAYLGWEEELSRGSCVNGPLRTLSDDNGKALASEGVRSILEVPIFLRGTFWGYIGFDDFSKERVFSENEETILRSASELIADALIRNEMEESLRTTAEELKIALNQAQSANHAKSDFLSRMSHEIRTPLNAVIGMTAIGKSSHEPEKKDYAFDKIDDASKHLLGIINDVLDMSKIEANKLELSHDEFEFDRLLQKVVGIVKFRVEECRQTLHTHIDGEIPATLIGDGQRFAQVITNLLSNAVKFTPKEGTIRLDAKLLSETNGLCCLQVSVSDTGIGLTEEQKSRIFRSFEQAEIGTSRQYGGTGLGLSITKRIVELMDGEIWVTSEKGKGATFTFTAVLQRGSGMRKRLLGKGVNWSNVRIFAVDDDREVRNFFLETSANLGIACDVAASGEEMVAMLEKDKGYDIYFIDWKLPGMDGIELARRIRGKAEADSLVLLFSSIEWSDIEQDAHAAGVNKFLSKPLFQSDVVDVINESLGLEDQNEQKESDGVADDFSGRTVLLVEDVEINREIVLALLEPMNLTVECAEDGAKALRMFKEAPDRYDVIFMDVQMPVMDGYEATRGIRALGAPHAKKVPIVAMTANVFREDVERCLEAGMDSHMGKPIMVEEVLDALRKYLQ